MKPSRAVLATTALLCGMFSLAACSSPGASPDAAANEIAGVTIEVDEDLATGVPEIYASEGEIVGVINPINRPAGYKNEKGEVVGSQIDIFKAAAMKLGLTPVVDASGGGGADVTGVKAGRYDMTIGTGSFQSRQAELDMVEYYKGGAALLIPAENPHDVTGPGSLCGLRVAVNPGVIQESMAMAQDEICQAEGNPAIEIVRLPEAISTALSAGRVDVAYETAAGAELLESQQPELFAIAGEPEWLAPNAFGFRKDNQEMRDVWMEAVQSLVDDGTYQAILDHWDQSLAAVSSITLNESEF
jgi:polar amino acid transport system substrate-binding protein